MGQEPFNVIHVYAVIFLKLGFVHSLSVNVWQVLWRSSEMFPVEMAEIQLLWLHVPTCTSMGVHGVSSPNVCPQDVKGAISVPILGWTFELVVSSSAAGA